MKHLTQTQDYFMITDPSKLLSTIQELHENKSPFYVNEDSLAPWSVSKIKVMQKCPLRFYLTYCLKIKFQREQTLEESVRVNVGLASHLLLERLIKGDTLHEARGLAKKEYSSLVKEGGWDVVDTAIPNMLAFVKRVRAFMIENPVHEIKTELRVGYSKDKQSTKFFDEENTYFRGVVDLVLLLKSGDAVITDHKFGVDPSQYGIRNQMFQLDSYKPLIHFGYSPITGAQAGVHGIESGEIVMEPSVSDFTYITETVPNLIDLYIQGGCQKIMDFGYFKHIRASGVCKWCEFDEICKDKKLVTIEKESSSKILRK